MKERIIHEKVIFHTLNQHQIVKLLAESVASSANLDLGAEDVSHKVLITRDSATQGYEAKVTITQDLSLQSNNEFTVVCALQDKTSTSTFHTYASADSSKEAARQALEECADAWECDVDDLVVLGMYRGNVSLAAWDDDGMTLDQIPEL